MVTINGVDTPADNQLLEEYLLQNGYSLSKIAVEINEEIVPKTRGGHTRLASGDTVEIVNFVSGG